MHEPAKREAAHVADEILEFLRNGEPRGIREVAETVDLSEGEVERVLDLLGRMGFVRKNAKMTNSGLDFLVKFLERMDYIRKNVRITDLGLDFLKLPVEGEEQEGEGPSEDQ